MKRKALLLVVLILVLVLLPAKDEDIWGTSYKKINSMAFLIDEYYFQDVDYDQMTYSSIRGFCALWIPILISWIPITLPG